MSKRVAVIGAGPAGATAAYCLAKGGADVDVFEATGSTGGMARSIELWGQTVDLGPHPFASGDPRVDELWLEVVGGDYEMVPRTTRVLDGGTLYPDPVHPRDLGLAEAARAFAGRFRRPRGADGFEAAAIARHGERLYRRFVQPYAEKLWGRPAAGLDAELARRAPQAGPFAYPRQGTGEVYARMCDYVRRHGGRVHLDAPVARLLVDGGRVTGVQLNTAEIHEYDHVVSSMPLTVLAARLPEAPAEVLAAARSLTYRNAVLVFLRTTAESVFPDTWIRVPDPTLRVGRITNFDNWAPALKHGERETILALEYWCSPGDEAWTWPDERHVALARRELAATGLVGAGEILDGEVVRVPKRYPVYHRGYRAPLRVVADHLRRLPGLEVVGRYGAFRHGDQAQSILMGLLAAENVLGAAGHDLWRPGAVPAQATRITETGLVRV
jgi:protoporphyrinogen oxidase